MNYKGAETYTEHRNLSRELYEEQKLSELHIEILCLIYVKKEQGYKINPADIFNLTNYRYSGEIYKQIKWLVEKEFLTVQYEKRKKKDKKYYNITVKAINAIQKILDA